MIPQFSEYCSTNAKDYLLKIFLAYVFESDEWLTKEVVAEAKQTGTAYQRTCALGYLAAMSEEFKPLFVAGTEALSARRFESRDAIVDNNPALLGLYVGLRSLESSQQGNWFTNLMNIKRGLGDRHEAFCNALEGNLPQSGEDSMELFLFLRQKSVAVNFVDQALSQFILGHWRKSFPFYDDFFRTVLVVQVLDSGLEGVLKSLEKTSARIPLKTEDLEKLEDASAKLENGYYDSAFRIVKEVLVQFDAPEEMHLWSVIKGRYSTHRNEKEMKGTVSNSESELTLNRIMDGLFGLIAQLKGG